MELDKIPVFLSGTPVSVGVIITFGKGFVKPRPIGSFSQNASLVIEGFVKGLQSAAKKSIDTNIAVKIYSYKDSFFIKDWSGNVTVFFALAKF